MHDITITGLTRVTRPKPNQGGNTIVAFFSCLVNGIRMVGCALVKTRSNGLTAWPPRVENEDSRRAVTFFDDSLQHEVKMRARDAYRALGGTDLETIGQSAVIGSYAERRQREESEGEAEGLARFIGNAA